VARDRDRPVFVPDPSAIEDAAEHHSAAVEFHLARSLDEAAREYDATLRLDPPREATALERATVLRFAPRVFVNASEPFALKDVAAIAHPSEPVIAYHLFFEDDVDFPDDNDPSDHEVMWVRYEHQDITQVSTLFHGRVVEGGTGAVVDASHHAMRPRIDVQWGKHGLMPSGWQSQTVETVDSDEDTEIPEGRIMTLLEYNKLTWKTLSTRGTRARDFALARRHRWPSRFAGDFPAFLSFNRQIDIRPFLTRQPMILVSRWNSAALARCLLFYNFRPKLEWPD
jgi:hypothetical protein